ncbi:replicative helicase loader/inhibitor [Gordonia alkanivorans]|uniref:Uncharacterized protein n=2 Tax=root TaxID=1 RepID=A0A161BYJ7_9CAUD|nr:replicative helicase loader/inhibitor [Gordonia alkanivorans]YP_009324460.1 hypothetical protein BOX05_gp68 [Gordonia phage GAL1]AKJ72083.1 hypothetical protein GAL1_68 [Gordonia phage GAL1]GAA13857.1 hypothetical protein GOALK_093_00450 [Gordonia alkanivorans NBRC 16433]
MTTQAEAMKVMLVVSACHQRTAPRIDDPEVTATIANVWADLFGAYNLELPDLVAAVKRRALKEPDKPAPEPGEIVKYAREIRAERAAKEQADPQQRALHEAKIDRKIASYAGGFGIQIDGQPR